MSGGSSSTFSRAPILSSASRRPAIISSSLISSVGDPRANSVPHRAWGDAVRGFFGGGSSAICGAEEAARLEPVRRR